jgi:signal transduction histidine kinase/ABC-type amino acid transport substrate-binding protein
MYALRLLGLHICTCLVSLLAVNLTEDERQWLQDNSTIVVGVEPAWPPFYYVDNELPAGLSNDLMWLMAERAGLEIRPVVDEFGDLVTALQDGHIDVLPAVWHRVEREEFLRFLPPYHHTRFVAFVHEQHDWVQRFRDLADLRVVGVVGYASTAQLYQHFDGSQITEVSSPLAALTMVNNGEADIYLGSMAAGNYLLAEHQLLNVMNRDVLRGTVFENNDPIHIAVRKELGHLVSILRKAQASITASEMEGLRSRWLTGPTDGWSFRYVLTFILVGSALCAFFIAVVTTWAMRLRRRLQAGEARRLELIKQKIDLQNVIESADAGIWSIDGHYRLTFFNTIFADLIRDIFGHELHVGDCVLDLPSAEVATMWRQRYDRALLGESYTFEEQMPAEYGEQFLSYRMTPLQVQEDIVGVTCVMHDVSRQKQFEFEQRQSMARAEDATRTKSMFLANISHEIRTPMNGILGIATLLSETRLDKEQRELLGLIQSSGVALMDILNDILNLSKIEAGAFEIKPTEMVLRPFLSNLIRITEQMERASNLTIRLDYDDQLPEAVLVDQGRLRQCLTNLLSNAVKFTHEGSVTLRVRPDQGAYVLMEVIDTGVGISIEGQKEIFGAFYQEDFSMTREHGGTGLGLAITKQLIELMGGEISVRSEYGHGTAFTIRMPLPEVQAPPTTVRPKTAALPVAFQGRVLIVEDNKVNYGRLYRNTQNSCW